MMMVLFSEMQIHESVMEGPVDAGDKTSGIIEPPPHFKHNRIVIASKARQ
jgi:hypothetical protein